jgi:hypothetical protein
MTLRSMAEESWSAGPGKSIYNGTSGRRRMERSFAIDCEEGEDDF